MSNIGYRKKGDSGPLYHPDRDYAYITPELMCGAIDRFIAAAAQFPEEQAWRAEHNITDEELAAAAIALAQAQKDFVNADDPVKSFDEALNRYNFKSVRLPVRQFLFSVFGFIFCAAWFKAVRDVSIVGEESPAQDGIASFAATARVFAAQCGITDIPNIDAEVLWVQRDVLLHRVAELEAANERMVQHISILTATQNKPKTLLQRLHDLLHKRTINAKVQDVQGPGTICSESR
jgi:hypothetical protein